jgi:transposase
MARRIFSREFKVSAVALVQQQGYSVAQAAKNLGIDPGSLRGWLKKFPSMDGREASPGPGAAQAELRQLREEVRRLTMERDILKKATVFFAKESP